MVVHSFSRFEDYIVQWKMEQRRGFLKPTTMKHDKNSSFYSPFWWSLVVSVIFIIVKAQKSSHNP